MEQLVAQLKIALGVDAETARIAAGHVLGFFQKAFPDIGVELVDKIPGAREAVAAAAAMRYKRNLLGALGGVGSVIGGKAEVLALTAKLTAMGLSPAQLQRLAKVVFLHAERTIGRQKLQKMTDTIPKLSQFLWPQG
ncbi:MULTISPECIES: hypothetical protein [Methylosinus]|uniref:DUF2267 domain-containing protein n=1 Tax=Methylosinus trichosporium (strain ATCC 35070 / NCIMB 11131 / UNIQEM 75 / OB3b) TaxID=595536 RepID=A0A2D2CVV6_METT3|nr:MULTISPECIES: hypothetical protein [Methylosinus]ATQ66845.1 hypothetical protein CQW49_02245 [Methylosinus trichosporium OB3b]OBS54283.1 hypothetical protein A8B73_01465 [Methylosinus sp. 3S-1]